MRRDSKNFGQVDSWDPLKVAQVVQMLVDADEAERAIMVLDNVPAFYRDNQDPMLVDLRRDIVASMVTAHAYMSCDFDSNVELAKAEQIISHTLRGMLIKAEVTKLNKQLKQPHIIDCGPGEYFVPLGLAQHQKVFTYEPIAMDGKAKTAFEALFEGFHVERQWKKTEPTIFCALEIIEHLPSPDDLAIEAMRYTEGRGPDFIHLSTPHYTYDGCPKSPGRNALPHLRAYTPREFLSEANRIFPGYVWQLYTEGDVLLSLRGIRNEMGADYSPLEPEVGDGKGS